MATNTSCIWQERQPLYLFCLSQYEHKLRSLPFDISISLNKRSALVRMVISCAFWYHNIISHILCVFEAGHAYCMYNMIRACCTRVPQLHTLHICLWYTRAVWDFRVQTGINKYFEFRSLYCIIDLGREILLRLWLEIYTYIRVEYDTIHCTRLYLCIKCIMQYGWTVAYYMR